MTAGVEYVLVIEGSPFVFGTGATAPSSYSDAVPEDATYKQLLVRPTFVISERLRPLEGNVEVSALEFVLANTDGTLSTWFARDPEAVSLTYLTTSAAAAASQFVVNSAARLGSLPRYVWIASECVEVTSIASGNTVNVARGMYGTVAQPIEADAARQILPRIYSYPYWLKGRRVRFYTQRGTTATLRWVGYVQDDLSWSENASSAVISCVHAWEMEARSRWGNPQPAASLVGYDSQCYEFYVTNADETLPAGSGTGSNLTARVHGSRLGAINAALGRLVTSLTSAGATNVLKGTPVETGDDLVVSVSFEGISKGRGELRVGGELFESVATENSGVVQHVWRIPAADGGAMVRAGFAGASAPAASERRATVIRRHANGSTSSWTPAVGSQAGVTITPVLVGDLDSETFLEIDPTGHTPAGFQTNDSDFAHVGEDTMSGHATFRGFARVLSKDPAANVRVDGRSLPASGTPIPFALPMRSEIRVDGPHWLDALRSILDDNTVATAGSDSRNWSHTGYLTTRRNARDALGSVSYRTNGNSTIGELVTGEAALRGCCVSVDGTGRLSIIDIRAPRADETVAATITADDQRALATCARADDGLVTTIVFETPVRTLTLADSVALAQNKSQNAIELTSQSLRRDPRVTNDPVGYAVVALSQLLGRWRDEHWVYRVEVSASRYASTCTLGAVVLLSSKHLPNREGGLGFENSNARRAIVLGRDEDLSTDALRLELLVLPVAWGFAPCVKVASISGDTLTLAGSYAGAAGDYAGSTLTGYRHTPGDKGASWFAAGYKARLILRDSTAGTTESVEVASVNAVAGTIKLTATVPTSPTNWPSLATTGWVDLVFDSWSTAPSTKRVFAAVSDETTELLGSDRPIRWSA